MARKPSARVVMNRAALDEVRLALADGVEEVARTGVEIANPPDASPYGAGLVTEGGWLVYVGTKKVAGGSLKGIQPKKPRSFRPDAGGISAIAGFGFPGRFQETGTAHQPARPWLTPAMYGTASVAQEIMADIVRPRLPRRG